MVKFNYKKKTNNLNHSNYLNIFLSPTFGRQLILTEDINFNLIPIAFNYFQL
jgi:hypothetical protein